MRSGLPYAPRSLSLREKLEYYSEPYVEGQCQHWLGAQVDGYGVLRWQGQPIKVHRATWEVEIGPIPLGMEVCHTCDNPPCRNIDHLFLGTHADNAADMVAKGRRAGGGGPPGSRNAFAKLTEADVVEIRAIPRDVPNYVVGAMYGVSRGPVNAIRTGIGWRHV